ncbi:hypothetical protein VNO80_26904 [Phaseolus coccineus]|uniref:Uncharacterized protein n=1 Tax=Phaseolus coccineus TaxID=3886 RepID=A0AAN9LFL1_PHACN
MMKISPNVTFEEEMKKIQSEDQGSGIPNNLPVEVFIDQQSLIAPEDLNELLFSFDSNFLKSLAEVVKAYEEHTYLKADGKNFAILASVSTLDVMYGSTFRSTIMKGMIENGAWQDSSSLAYVISLLEGEDKFEWLGDDLEDDSFVLGCGNVAKEYLSKMEKEVGKNTSNTLSLFYLRITIISLGKGKGVDARHGAKTQDEHGIDRGVTNAVCYTPRYTSSTLTSPTSASKPLVTSADSARRPSVVGVNCLRQSLRSFPWSRVSLSSHRNLLSSPCSILPPMANFV